MGCQFLGITFTAIIAELCTLFSLYMIRHLAYYLLESDDEFGEA